MTSEVSICNQAISWLAGNAIISLDDNTTEGILCKANYDLLRDTVQAEGKWPFCTSRIKLVLSPDAPVWGYSHKFEIPSTVLTLILVSQYEDPQYANYTAEFNWRREENFIVANVSQVWAKVMVRVEDPKRFSSLFTQALAARLAAEIAAPMTESTTKETRMWEKYHRNLALALAVDGQQGHSDRIKTKSRIVNNR